MNWSTVVEPMRDAGTRARRAVAPSGWTSSGTDAVLIVTVWVAIMAPQLVESLSVTKGFVPITGTAAPVPELVATVTRAGDALIFAVCALIVVVRLRTLELRRAGVLVALLVPWALAVGQLAGLGRTPGSVALVYPAVAVAFWVLRPQAGAIQTMGYLTGLTALLSIILGVFVPAAGRYPPDTGGLDKAIGPAGVLAGIMPSGNNLGLILVLGLPSVLTIARLRVRWAALVAVLVALAWTSSRTSWIAAIVVGVVLALVGWRSRGALLAGLGLAGLAVAGIVLPLATTDPTAFVNRAGYWIRALGDWREHPLTGLGADYFKRLAQTTENLGGFAYQAHNEWVQLLVTGGLLLAVAVLALLTVAAVRAVRLAGHGVRWGAGWLAGLLTVSILEVPLGVVDRVMFLPFTLVPLCLLICGPLAVGASRGEDRNA